MAGASIVDSDAASVRAGIALGQPRGRRYPRDPGLLGARGDLVASRRYVSLQAHLLIGLRVGRWARAARSNAPQGDHRRYGGSAEFLFGC